MPDGTELVNLPDETPAAPEPDGDPPSNVLLHHEEHWIAPLLPPGVLRTYDEVLPWAAERILAMAENQQQHRLEQEKAFAAQEQYALETARIAYVAESGRSRLGLIFAFVIVLAGLGAGVGLIAAGAGGWALAFIFAPLASLAGVFVYAERARRAERRRNIQDDE